VPHVYAWALIVPLKCFSIDSTVKEDIHKVSNAAKNDMDRFLPTRHIQRLDRFGGTFWVPIHGRFLIPGATESNPQVWIIEVI
jgi:hypothetical protein